MVGSLYDGFEMDIIACIFEVCGAWLVGNKNKWGFVVFMIGNYFWLLTGINNGLRGLVIVSVVFGFINVRNFKKWHRKKS